MFVAGTFAGQTRIRGVQTGLLGVISETVGRRDRPFAGDAAYHFGLQGDREAPDLIVLP